MPAWSISPSVCLQQQCTCVHKQAREIPIYWWKNSFIVLSEEEAVIIWWKIYKQVTGIVVFLRVICRKNSRFFGKNLSTLLNCETVMFYIYNWNRFFKWFEKLVQPLQQMVEKIGQNNPFIFKHCPFTWLTGHMAIIMVTICFKHCNALGIERGLPAMPHEPSLHCTSNGHSICESENMPEICPHATSYFVMFPSPTIFSGTVNYEYG